MLLNNFVCRVGVYANERWNDAKLERRSPLCLLVRWLLAGEILMELLLFLFGD